ncbi:MAG: hypothetical protein ACJ789_01440 [Thermomicrobiales bacterium]
MRHYRQEWIAALESGRFPQVFGKVREGNKRCAMGVGLEVLREHDGLPEPSKPTFFQAMQVLGTRLGISARQLALVNEMNDRLHLSHAEIAQILRQFERRDTLNAAEHDPAAWEDWSPRVREDSDISSRE